jgi:hypothetical protein
VRPTILHSHDYQQSQADVSRANQSRIHSATQNSCAVSHVHGARRPRKKAEEVTPARSGRVVAVAQEALTPARIRRGLRGFRNANGHRHLIEHRQKQKYPQELYI